jgi:hypothetical protein
MSDARFASVSGLLTGANMRLRLALTAGSLLGLTGTPATTNSQPLIDRNGEARKMVMGGGGGRDFLEVDAAHRRYDISRTTHAVVTDSDSEEVVGEIAETPADSDLSAARAEG